MVGLRQKVSVLVLVSLVSAACSTDDTFVEQPMPQTDEIVLEPVEQATVDLAAIYGVDGAFVRVAVALDNGYSAAQILAATPADLETVGEISGLNPERAPTGAIRPVDPEVPDAGSNEEGAAPPGTVIFAAWSVGGSALGSAQDQSVESESDQFVILALDQTLGAAIRSAESSVLDERTERLARYFDRRPERRASDSLNTDRRYSALALFLALMQRGYSAEQILLLFAQGLTTLELGLPFACASIEGEAPAFTDLLADQCASSLPPGYSPPASAVPETTAPPTTSAATPATTAPLQEYPDDGIYEGVAPDEWFRKPGSGVVNQNRISLQIEGGVLQSFDLFVDVRGNGAVFDFDGVPMCIGDTLFSMRALTTPPIVDGVILLPVERFGSRSNIQATPRMDGKTCNPTLAGESSQNIDLQITVSGDRADIRILQDGEPLDAGATLQRTS